MNAFAVPAQYTYGDGGRNILRADGLKQLDFTLMKIFPVTESKQVQFRAEMFNIANHANFGVPIADLASPNFGRVLQSGSPRLTQFAVKVVF